MFERLDNVRQDIWDHLRTAGKQLVLYGTGNGADKIIDALDAYGVRPTAVFASDDFARNREFRGYPVKTYAQVASELSDFVVLVAFATQRCEVIENIDRIAAERELYAPDVPAYGEGLFTTEYFRAHRERLQAVYDSLADNLSRKTFVCTLLFKLTGRIAYLKECETTKEEIYGLLNSAASCRSYVDIGAYTGDTIEEYTDVFGKNMTVFAFEPDLRNFRKLKERIDRLHLSCHAYPYAAWDKDEDLIFDSRSGRSAAINGNCERKNTNAHVRAVRADDHLTGEIGCIKIDAEGADKQALTGLSETIAKQAPVIKVAAYHRTGDFFAIPETVFRIRPDYRLYMRHLPYIPGWDTDFIFCPHTV